MPYSLPSLSANEIAWAADDKPFFSGNAAIVADDIHWVVGTSSADWVTNPTDQSATGFEGYRVVDGLPGRVSKPNAASTAFTVLFDFSSNPITFDWIGVVNHNLYTLATTVLRTLISDNSDFTAPSATLSTINVSTSYSADRRFTDLDLRGSDTRATNASYVRLQITCSSGTPYIGQVIFGRRYQQHRAPEVPWDPTNETSSMFQLDTPGGVRRRKAKRKGRREINAAFTHDAGWPALSGFTAFETDVDDWWAAIRCGKEPFYWVDEPNSNPDDFWMFQMVTPELQYPHVNSTTRQLVVRGVEQGPQAQYFSQGP